MTDSQCSIRMLFRRIEMPGLASGRRQPRKEQSIFPLEISAVASEVKRSTWRLIQGMSGSMWDAFALVSIIELEGVSFHYGIVHT